MYKLPIKTNLSPIVTQYYGNTSLNSWYVSNGIKNPFHNGLDLVTGTNRQTYGTELVCPFPEGGYVDEIVYDSPMSTKGNGVYVKSNLLNNEQVKMILWHTGEIAVKKGQVLKEGDTICYIGNSGLCNPPPTTDNPYSGSHLHFGCYKYKNGSYVCDPKQNVMGECNPLLHFDKTQWYKGEDSGTQHDMNPLYWMWNKLGIIDWYMKLLTAFKQWSK
jgi:murein DD-endopeptidase MepM/ murein hydrolase activator NlpD